MSESISSDQDVFFVEELSVLDVPEEEIAQFKLTQPLQVVSVISDQNLECSPTKPVKETESESTLIKKFVCGEVEFPDLYTKFETEEKLADLSDEENESDTLLSLSPEKSPNIASLSLSTVSEGNSGTGRHRGRGIRKRSTLTGALQGLMGEANLSFARGQIEKAEKICLEIIRLNPLAPEPFYTLAEINEPRDPEKYLNFMIIASHLNPGDLQQTVHVAEMFKSRNDYARARLYFSRAIKYYPRDYELRLQKARLLEEMNEKSASMITYLKMIPLIPIENKNFCMDIAKKVANYFHSVSKNHLALEAMESAFKVCSKDFTIEFLNLYLQILIMNKLYAKVISCLSTCTNFAVEMKTVEGDEESIDHCVIPDNFVPELRTKVAICLIHLRADHLIGYLIHNIHEHIEISAENMDLYAEVIEAFMQEEKYKEAIKFMRPITKDKNMECTAFIWLKHADCLRFLNRIDDAIKSYYLVLKLAPLCYEAKFTVSALLKQQGRHVEAVKALEQSHAAEGQPLNARLLYERCIMLKQINRIEEFLEEGCILLARHSLKLQNREEMSVIASGANIYNAESLKVILQMRNIIEDSDKAWQEFNKAQAEDPNLMIADEFDLFLNLIQTAFEHRKYSIIEKICFAMITTKRFSAYHEDLERITILACFFNSDCTIAFSYLRDLISRSPNNTSLWNLLALLIRKGHDLRYHRYVRRVVQKCPVPPDVQLFLGHYNLQCCSYKYALNVYVPLFKSNPQPLLALCIAVAFNQISLQKKVQRKTAAIGQAICFVKKYAELRETELKAVTANNESSPAYEEICYNMGRMFHQAGFIHLAIEYYERGLQARNDLIEANDNYLGLKHEIAYNLHLIYKASGNECKARDYLYKYCIV